LTYISNVFVTEGYCAVGRN